MRDYIVYNTLTGEVLRAGKCQDDVMQVLDDGESEMSAHCPYLQAYIKDGLVFEKTELAETFDKKTVIADGIDAATISNLPEHTVVSIHGTDYPATNGSYSFVTTTPGLYTAVIYSPRHSPCIVLLTAVPDLAGTKREAAQTIDTAAGAARARYITAAPGQEATYIAKEADARAFLASTAGASVESYPWVAAEAQASGKTAIEAAQTIVALADAWVATGAAIEGVRMGGKYAVNAASDISAINAIVEQTVSQLNQI